MTIYIGMDDTDTLQSRGTGRLAREIAGALAVDYPVLGVTRHQLLLDARVPCTKNNSAAAIVLQGDGDRYAELLAGRMRGWMMADYQPGSDPGLCVARHVPKEVIAFGRRAKRELVSRREAYALAAVHDLVLEGLEGTDGGVIGALAAVGLAASGQDGRYVMVGRLRELAGLQPVSAVLAAGVAAVQTIDGEPVTEGLIHTDRLRPARRDGRPVAVVEWADDGWLPLRLD